MRLAAILLCSVALAGGGDRTIAARGVQVVVPAGWQRVAAADDGPVADPRTLLVAGTPGIAPRTSRCQIAAYRIPPDGAVVVVVGWRTAAPGGPRPGRAPLKKLVRVTRPSFECFSGRGAAAYVVLGGKGYQVNVLVGDRAGKRRVGEALAVARSFALVR